MAQGIVVDFHFDLICPWCLIGKRHLDRALVELARTDPEVKIDLRWHSVQLLPDVPTTGLDFNDFYVRRLGSVVAVRQRQQQVREAALLAGATVDFSRMARMPNTRQAHQLLRFSRARLAGPAQWQLMERLLAAHFSLGEDLGDQATLLIIARESGLPVAELGHCLDSDIGLPASLDVPGVPCFAFNRQITVSGAQPPAVLLAAMRQVLDAQPAPMA